MPRVVRLSVEATQDLADIRAWQLQRGSGAAARGRISAILRAIELLGEAPCRHAVGDHPGRREFTVSGHRVVYVVQPDTASNATAGDVLVLRVYGPGQSRA